MNIQTVRESLALFLDEITPDGWASSTATAPNIYTGLIHVGHALEIAPDTFKTFRADIPITLWVDESIDKEAQSKLYQLVSPMDGSILRHLLRHATFSTYTVGPVAPRDQGPSVYLTADIVVRVEVTSTPSS